MEWIFIGICIAIGFYLAPLIVGFIVGCIAILFEIIGSIFKTIFRW